MTYYIEMRSLIEGCYSYTALVLSGIMSIVGLSLCPLLFCYMRSVIRDSYPRRWYLWLFTPVVIYTIAVTLLFFLVGWDNVLDGYQSDHLFYHPNPNRPIDVVYGFVNIQLFNYLLMLMSVVTITICLYYLYKYVRKTEDYFSNLDDASVGHIKYFLCVSVITILVLFLVTYFVHPLVESAITVYGSLSLLIALLLGIMSYHAYHIHQMNKGPEIVKELLEEASEERIVSYHPELENMINTWASCPDKPFCRQGITAFDVARDLNISARTTFTIHQSKQGHELPKLDQHASYQRGKTSAGRRP